MGSFWNRCCKGCHRFFGGPGNGKILLCIVTTVLMISLLFNPFILTGLALIGLFMWAIFF